MFGVIDGQCTIYQQAGGVHCEGCRKGAGKNGFPMECPRGYSTSHLPRLLGDTIEGWIPKRVKNVLECYDANKKLRPDSGCGQRKADWNKVTIGTRKVST